MLVKSSGLRNLGHLRKKGEQNKQRVAGLRHQKPNDFEIGQHDECKWDLSRLVAGCGC